MLNAIQDAISSYVKRPFPFIFIGLIHLGLQVLITLALIGIFLLIFFTASVFRITFDSPIMMVAVGLLIIAFLFFTYGLKGAAYYSYNNTLKGLNVTFFDFYDYLFRNSKRFFIVFIIRLFITLLFIMPLVIVYFYFLKNYNIKYLEIVIGLISAFLLFMVHFIFYSAFASVAISSTNTRESLAHAFLFLKTKHISTLLLYSLYSIIWVTQFIPLIQIASFFVFFPIVYSAIVISLREITQNTNPNPSSVSNSKPIAVLPYSAQSNPTHQKPTLLNQNSVQTAIQKPLQESNVQSKEKSQEQSKEQTKEQPKEQPKDATMDLPKNMYKRKSFKERKK